MPEELVSVRDQADAVTRQQHQTGADAQDGDRFEKSGPGIRVRGGILPVVFDHVGRSVRCPGKG